MFEVRFDSGDVFECDNFADALNKASAREPSRIVRSGDGATFQWENGQWLPAEDARPLYFARSAHEFAGLAASFFSDDRLARPCREAQDALQDVIDEIQPA